MIATEFQSVWARAIRRRRISGILRAASATVVMSGGVLLLLGFADAIFAFPAPVRTFLLIAWLGGSAAHLFHGFRSRVRIPEPKIARELDDANGDRRRTLLSAWEIARQTPADNDDSMAAFLRTETVRNGIRALNQTPEAVQWNRSHLIHQARRLGIFVALTAALLAIFPALLGTTVSRILAPWADLPPWSNLRFTVLPEEPEVLYGGELQLTLEIDGGSVEVPVHFARRNPVTGETEETLCFRKDEKHWVVRLSNVTEETEFSFRAGRARSTWEPVRIRTEPRIVLVRATLEPPEYTGLAASSFFLNGERLVGLKQTRVGLELSSNRPLRGGSAEVLDPVTGAPLDRIEGVATGEKTVGFKWHLDHNADLAFSVLDVEGTTNQEPLRLRQTAVDDLPPEASLYQPGPYTLATPSAVLEVNGEASDDIGVTRLSLVRSINQFQERFASLGPEEAAREYRFTENLDLARLGVVPGEILSFHLVARDLNPSLTGIGSSPSAVVRIISEEEYAENLRTRITIEQFAQKMRRVRSALQAVDEALAKWEEAAESGSGDASEAREEARRKIDQAASLLEALTNDFPIYDAEEAARSQLGELKRLLESIEQATGGISASGSEAADQIRALREALTGPRNTQDQTAADAGKLAELHKVLRHAATFRRLYAEQQSLEEATQRFRNLGNTSGAAATELAELGRRQESLCTELNAALEALRNDAADLAADPDLAPLVESAFVFADTAEDLRLAATMVESSQAAAAGKGNDAWLKARQARLTFEKLFSDCEGGFGGMCQNQMTFSLGSLTSTLAQMLSGILGLGTTPGSGAGTGGGTGAGEGGLDGYSVSGFTPLNIPIAGPQRISLGEAAAAGEGSGGGSGREGATTVRTTLESGDDQPSGEGEEKVTPAFRIEDAPPEYRPILKRYFESTISP